MLWPFSKTLQHSLPRTSNSRRAWLHTLLGCLIARGHHSISHCRCFFLVTQHRLLWCLSKTTYGHFYWVSLLLSLWNSSKTRLKWLRWQICWSGCSITRNWNINQRWLRPWGSFSIHHCLPIWCELSLVFWVIVEPDLSHQQKNNVSRQVYRSRPENSLGPYEDWNTRRPHLSAVTHFHAHDQHVKQSRWMWATSRPQASAQPHFFSPVRGSRARCRYCHHWAWVADWSYTGFRSARFESYHLRIYVSHQRWTMVFACLEDTDTVGKESKWSRG